MTRPTEDELIARYFAPLAGEGGLGLRDDAAVVTPTPGHDLVVTTDAIVAGVHFFPDDPPDGLARKALGVNVSDLSAKGARPIGFVLTLGLHEGWDADFLAALTRGLGDAAEAMGCALLGGDTVRANGPLTLGVTAFGEVPSGRMVRRTTARPGDRVCVSGTIGDGALGLLVRPQPSSAGIAALSEEDKAFLLDRYRHPRPRTLLAEAVRDCANAAMDVSDGLAGDLAKMLRVSGVTAEVERAAIPLSPAARRAVAAEPTLFDRAVTGGDDYEILCTVPEGRLAAFQDAAGRAGVPVTVIGTVRAGEGLPIFRDDVGERRYQHGSFSHY